jgi:succinoglycan biosynthesis transport protein ExoP
MRNESLPALTAKNGHVRMMPGEDFPMAEHEREISSSGLNLYEILFILFRHKWKILLCAVAGVLAAAAIYFVLPRNYESEAKLLVRYVVDKSTVDTLDTSIKTPNSESGNLMNSEVQILTSADVAGQVAQAIGIDRLEKGAKGKATLDDATRDIVQALEVTAPKDSNIITISYKSKDPGLPTLVLEEVVKKYFDKHLEVHRSLGAFDFVTQQTNLLASQLSQTDQELKRLKSAAGVTSLAESTKSLATELSKTQEDLDAATADLAAQQARVSEIEKWSAGTTTKKSDDTTPSPSREVVQEYQSLVTRETQLRQMETELLSKYTPQNRIVKVKQAQIADLEKQRREMENRFPGLLAMAPAATSTTEEKRPDLMSERARLVSLQAQTENLKTRLAGLQERSKTLSELGPRIAELERTKEVQESNYKYLEASLEKARIDETLNPARMPNISIVQKPTPAVKTTRDVKKFVMGLAGGGLGVGIAIALLIELFLDRTVKRSLEVENRLRLPLLLSIPYLDSGSKHLRLHDSGRDSDLTMDGGADDDLVDTGELLRPFCEAIRDRLGFFFEANQMAHKPKLVAVTGLSKNAGASTLAAGLAATLSETNEGKVLLVDKPVTPKRFYNMLSEFRDSDLDYVVFDLPSLGDTSVTLPLAGFMDTVLLVVEAEKSNRDAVKRAYEQLAAKTQVSVVFNKSKSYGPKWLQGEL